MLRHLTIDRVERSEVNRALIFREPSDDERICRKTEHPRVHAHARRHRHEERHEQIEVRYLGNDEEPKHYRDHADPEYEKVRIARKRLESRAACLHDPIVESRLGEHRTQPERDADEEKRCPVHTRLERRDVDHLQHEHENECRKTDRHGGDVVERLGRPQYDRHQDDSEHALLHCRKRSQAIGNRLAVALIRPSAQGLDSRALCFIPPGVSAFGGAHKASSAAQRGLIERLGVARCADGLRARTSLLPSPVHPHNQEVVQRKHNHQPRQRRHKPRRHVELLLHIGRQRRHERITGNGGGNNRRRNRADAHEHRRKQPSRTLPLTLISQLVPDAHGKRGEHGTFDGKAWDQGAENRARDKLSDDLASERTRELAHNRQRDTPHKTARLHADSKREGREQKPPGRRRERRERRANGDTGDHNEEHRHHHRGNKLGQNAGNPPHDSHDENTEHRRCLIGQSRNRAGRDKNRCHKRTRRSTSQLDPSLRFLFHQHTPSLAIDAVNHTPK